MVSPCPGHPVSTPYGATGSSWSTGWHDGADYAAPTGSPVVAAWGGYVEDVGYPSSFGSAFGRSVVVDHDVLPGGGGGGWGLYAHLSSSCVARGDRVEAGQLLGEVGSTGNSSGPHLHFGVYPNPYWCSACGLDPQPWIDAGEETDMPLTQADLDQIAAIVRDQVLDIVRKEGISGAANGTHGGQNPTTPVADTIIGEIRKLASGLWDQLT